MSRCSYDFINVIDLELTCWDDEKPPENEQAEIIEFGIAQIDLNLLTPRYAESILVRPTISKVSQFCTDLTGHSWEELRTKGMPFVGACNRLVKNYGTRKRINAYFGNDYDCIEKQCKLFGIENPLGPYHMDIAQLARMGLNSSKTLSLKNCLELMGIESEGRQHNAKDDAINTAKLLMKLLEKMRPKEIECVDNCNKEV